MFRCRLNAKPKHFIEWLSCCGRTSRAPCCMIWMGLLGAAWLGWFGVGCCFFLYIIFHHVQWRTRLHEPRVSPLVYVETLNTRRKKFDMEWCVHGDVVYTCIYIYMQWHRGNRPKQAETAKPTGWWDGEMVDVNVDGIDYMGYKNLFNSICIVECVSHGTRFDRVYGVRSGHKAVRQRQPRFDDDDFSFSCLSFFVFFS